MNTFSFMNIPHNRLTVESIPTQSITWHLLSSFLVREQNIYLCNTTYIFSIAENVEKSEKTATSEHIQTKQKDEKVTISVSGKKPASSSVINSNATPFYPASYVPVPPPAMPSVPSNYTHPPVSSQGHQGVAVGVSPPGVPSPHHPNLFLYSPSSNTMIPCEEIIIPNAVVPGQDVYQVKMVKMQ